MNANLHCRFIRDYCICLRLRLIGVTIMLLLSSRAMANSDSSYITATSTLGTGLWSQEVTSSSNKWRFSLHTRDDAAAFVASEGDIRGVHFEQAVVEIRQSHSLNVSDLEIARFILSST